MNSNTNKQYDLLKNLKNCISIIKEQTKCFQAFNDPSTSEQPYLC